MDEELKNFECELRRLQPVAPSHELEARIARELDQAPALSARRPRATVHWVWLATVPAAAAAAVLLSMFGSGTGVAPVISTPHGRDARATAPTAVTDAFKPVAAENVLYAARDEGLVVLEDGTPARRERLQFVDTITWKNPRTNASLRWTVPREEVRVVPISFQ
jgi:hypothetical protein